MPRRLPSFIFPLIATILVAAFLWWPALALYGQALWQVMARQPERWVEMLPLRPLQRSLFLNTLLLSLLTAGGSILLGVPVGLALARSSMRWQRLQWPLCALPLALPPTLCAAAWLEITRTPPARSLASLAADRPLPISSIPVAALVLALCFFPVVALPLQAARRAIPADAEDAARLFENNWGVWRHVVGPLLAPALWGAAGLVAALAMWEMGAPDLLDARTYSVQIYRELNAPDNLDPQGKAVKAALAAMPMLLLGSLALWPALRALRFYDVRIFGSAAAPETTSTLETRLATFCSFFIFALSPLAILLIFATQLRPLRVLGEVWISNGGEIINTLGLSTLAALLITTASFALVAAWHDWPGLGRVALPLCVTPLLIAPVMLGIALISFWNRTPLYAGWAPTGNLFLDWLSDLVARYAIMLIGYAARFGPLAILLLHEASRRVDPALLEAARNLGASPMRAARTVSAPLLAPALLGVFALVWTLCAAELSTSVLINAPGGQTLPVPIFNLMHVGSTAEVAALSLTLVVLNAAVMGLAFAAWRLNRS